MNNTEKINAGNIKDKIRNFIIDNFFFGSIDEPINDDDSFLETGIIDSTGLLEVIEFIEQTYSIQIDTTETTPENFDSLNNLDKFITAKIKDS